MDAVAGRGLGAASSVSEGQLRPGAGGHEPALWRSALSAVDGPSARFGRSLAVVIGIDTYGEDISPLRSAVADASAIAEALRRDHGFEVWCLFDDHAQLLALGRDQLPRALGPRGPAAALLRRPRDRPRR